jgi:hypothetical protein
MWLIMRTATQDFQVLGDVAEHIKLLRDEGKVQRFRQTIDISEIDLSHMSEDEKEAHFRRQARRVANAIIADEIQIDSWEAFDEYAGLLGYLGTKKYATVMRHIMEKIGRKQKT